MTELEYRKNNFKDAIILALHKTMLESDLKENYLKHLNHFPDLFCRYDDDTFLEHYLFDGQEDQFPV